MRAAAARWWVLGLVSGSISVIVTIVALAIWSGDGFRMPFDDWALDQEGVVSAHFARVHESTVTSSHIGSQRVHRIRYTFDDGRRNMAGTCYSLGGRFEAGQQAAVEYLSDSPDVHRLRNSFRAQAALWLPTMLYLWLLPTFVFAFWGTRVYRTLVLLKHGRAAEAVLEGTRKTTMVNPPQLRVHYSFADGQGRQHEGRQWLRRGSLLGRRVAAMQPGEPIPGCAAVHDEGAPEQNRLLAAEDAATDV